MDRKCFLKTSLVAAAATVASVAGAGRAFASPAQQAGETEGFDEIVDVVVVLRRHGCRSSRRNRRYLPTAGSHQLANLVKGS